MKRYLIGAIVLAILLLGCGGGNAATPGPATSGTGGQENIVSTTPDENTTDPAEEAAEVEAEAATDDPAEEEGEVEAGEDTAQPAADDPNLVAGLPSSGIDPETNLEINPTQIVPGVDFIVRGRLVSFNLTPQDSPEFLVESPAGTRYRVQSQPVSEIAFADGTVLLPHQYQRGMIGQATVRQEEGAGVTTVVTTENFTLLAEE
jgi:hypothetical protein